MLKTAIILCPTSQQKTVSKTEIKQNRKMLAQQIIFGLFNYELLYSYNHALPSPHQKSYPYIASH